MQKEVLNVNTANITDTKGARAILERRQGDDRTYSVDTLHYHVRQGNLPAYIFDAEGDLVRWQPSSERRGASYIFLKYDVENFPLESKVGRKPKPKTVPTPTI
jgi:hypothetical protein